MFKKIKRALSVIPLIMASQLYAPWLLMNVPGFRRLKVSKATRRQRGMYPDQWEHFAHGYSPGEPQLEETPAQLNIRGTSKDGRFWSIGIDLEHDVFGWADWGALLNDRNGGSGDLGVVIFGLPGVILTSPIWLTTTFLRTVFERFTGMPIEMWWVRNQLIKQLTLEDQRALDTAFKNHYNGAETTYFQQKTAEYQDKRNREMFAERQKKQNERR